MSNTPIRILVCGHDLKFLQPLLRRFERTDTYELRVLYHEGHQLRDLEEAQRCLDWADVIFCEWAVGNAVWFSQNKRAGQVLIVRLHLQEVQARERIDFIYATDWSRVDRLIVITQHIYDWMRREFPILASRCALVYNPIPAQTVLNLPKADESRYVLGLVGVVPARKRLDIAVELLRALRVTDQRYILRVKGALPQDYAWMASRQAEMDWYERIFNDTADLRQAGAVVFDPHGPDMAGWYRGIGHILSVSDFEGSHQAVAEGMATGCVPAIRDWEGASRIYPAHYVAGTVDELAAIVRRNTELDVFRRESAECRLFSSVRFDETPVCDAIESIIAHELRRQRPHQLPLAIPARVAAARPTFMILAYVPVGARSGYRIRVEQEIQILVQLGCIVHLACLLPTTPDAAQESVRVQREAHVREFAALGCNVHLLEIEDFFRLRVDSESFPPVVAALAALVEEHAIDVLHAEALYCARVAALVKERLSSLQFTIDWHGVVPEESRMGGAHENRVKALEVAENELLKRCDMNIFVSEAMARHYKTKYALGLLPQVVVPCCVSDERFVDPSSISENSGDDNSLLFAYAGSMADWQCGAEMIMLFAALNRHDARCSFLLLVPESDHDKVRKYAEEAGLASSVYTLQAVAHDEVPDRLAAAHVGVLLRRRDAVNEVSSPTKFGEYLAAGLPVLMTEGIGDFSELVRDEETGVIVPSVLLDQIQEPGNLNWLRMVVEAADRSKFQRNYTVRRCQAVARRQLQWEPSALGWLSELCGQ